MSTTALLHDARPQARRRLELLLRQGAGLDDIVVAEDPESLLAHARRDAPDFVALGVSRRDPGADLVRRVKAAVPTVAVLVAGPSCDAATVGATLAAGAVGFLRWDAPRSLVQTMVGVATETTAGADLLPVPSPNGAGNGRPRGPHVDIVVQRSLSASVREVQVLAGIGRGLTNAEIGRRLYLSEHTVKTHATRLFRRLGATDRAGAVGRAWEMGLFVRGPEVDRA